MIVTCDIAFVIGPIGVTVGGDYDVFLLSATLCRGSASSSFGECVILWELVKPCFGRWQDDGSRSGALIAPGYKKNTQLTSN